MRDTPSVAIPCGYVLTEAGLVAVAQAEVCKCDMRLVGRQIICRNCETLYGEVSRTTVGNYWGGRPQT